MQDRGLIIGWPNAVQHIQRRHYFRLAIPSNRRIGVRLWDGGLA